MRNFYTTAALCLLAISALSQDSLLWPLNCEYHLTSTFAEYRVGHFHAGVDFRTPDGEGMPLFAIADGSVIRARETPWGYGKVVYFQTKNGVIAVLAHLSGFTSPLSDSINAEKYRHKKNTAELWFKEGEMAFKAGDTLCFSGSTGAGSPHLHFELRDGLDKPFNAMFAGYVTKDDIPPQIEAVWLIPRDDNAHIEGRHTPKRIAINENKQTYGPIHAFGPISLCIEAHDRECDSNYNKFGVYRAELFADDKPVYIFHADTFSYARTRQIGLLYDLGLQEEFGLKRPPFRLDHPIGADISMLEGSDEGSGIIAVEKDTVNLTIKVADFIGNSTELSLQIAPAEVNYKVQVSVDSAEGKFAIGTTLQPEDTAQFRLEYIKEGKSQRANMPVEGKAVELPGDITFAQILATNINTPVWVWRPGKNTEPTVSINIHGNGVILITADFSEPITRMPSLRRGDSFLVWSDIHDSSCVFRIFGLKADETLILLWHNGQLELAPRLWTAKSNEKYNLSDNRWRLEIPDGGVFSPFIARDTLFPADSTTSEGFRIEPAGVVLSRPAKLLFDTTGTSSKPGKLCLVRIWEGKTFFISNRIDDEGFLYGKINAFGTFGTALDTLPPKLKIGINDGARISKLLTANVSDDLSGFSNNVLPNSFIDDIWRPTEYDPEKARISLSVEDLEAGEHIWRIVASDVAGNVVSDSVRFRKD